MFSRNLLAVLAIVAAAPAFAAGVSAGDAQLARIAGVEPGVYSTAQLIRLDQARQDNDAETVRFILASPEGTLAATRADTSAASLGDSAVSAGAAQFALILGVEPGAYSLDDLTRLDRARHDNDAETERAILSGALDRPESAIVTPGKAQLAASLGVDPAAYTLAELSALAGARLNARNDH